MTIVPRTGPFSASSAPDTTSWYQRGKSSARDVRDPAAIGERYRLLREPRDGEAGGQQHDGPGHRGQRPLDRGQQAGAIDRQGRAVEEGHRAVDLDAAAAHEASLRAQVALRDRQ